MQHYQWMEKGSNAYSPYFRVIDDDFTASLLTIASSFQQNWAKTPEILAPLSFYSIFVLASNSINHLLT